MLRGIWSFALLVASTAIFAVIAIVGSLLLRRPNITLRLGKRWSRLQLWALALHPVYHGLEHLRTARPCVFIANHQSMVDLWALMPVLPDDSLFVAKRELFRIPLLGQAIAAGGFVPIDRGRRERAIRSLRQANEQIRAGRPFVLFAEGTRSHDGRLGPFKKGAFHVALQTRARVVPVAISGAWGVLRPRSVRVRPGPVRVTFGPPVPIDPFLPDDVQGLSRAVREVIVRGLEPHEVGAGDRDSRGHST